MSDGYRILSLDDVPRYRGYSDSITLMPLRRTVGFRPFGVNAWLGERAGDHVIQRHYERDGDEELYVVVRGRATFTVGDETVDATPGTFVHLPPGTFREAVAAEDDTLVLAVGAKPGEPWEPAPWEEFHIAFSLRSDGKVAEARTLIEETLARFPGTWQGEYNAACFESLEGKDDAAFAYLTRAYEREPKIIGEFAPDDPDLRRLHDDPRWQELFG